MTSRLSRRLPRTVLVAVAVFWALVAVFVLAPAATNLLHDSPAESGSPPGPEAIDGRLENLRLMNYFPAQAAWTDMWTQWDPTRIDEDFARIAALGANTVRLNIDPYVFGFPTPTASMTQELARTVDAAKARGLGVQLTLFDWWSAYQDTAASDEWVRALLAPYRGDGEIAFIDVKNEIDPEDAAATAWLEHELPVVEQAAGGIQVTVSVTGPNLLANLSALRKDLAAAPPDFYDIHYYGQAERAVSTFGQARALVAPKPVYVGETGASTDDGKPEAIAEAEQDLYLRTVEWAARAAGLPDAAPWIFQDVAPDAAPAAAGADPAQLDYGLFHVDGEPKPAAESIKSLFTTGNLSSDLDGAFDIGSGTTVADWTPVRVGAADLEWAGGVGRTAPGSVMLRGTGTSDVGDPAFEAAPVIQPTYTGRQVTLTAWVKGVNTTGRTRIAVCWFAASGGYIGETDSPDLPLGTVDWTSLTVTSAAPAQAAYDLVYLESGNDSGTVFFDDVTLSG